MTDRDPQRHPKMVRAATYLAESGYDISKMPVELGKGGRFRWKDYATRDPALIPNLLGGAVNSVVIPRGLRVVVDADEPEAYQFLCDNMPPGLRVNSPTEGHGHFYGWYAEPQNLPDVYRGGEVRRDPGGKDAPGGAGGMVIGPWSRTQAGVYTIVEGSRDIPELPESVAEWLRERAEGKPRARTAPPPVVPPTNGHATEEPILIAVTEGGYQLPEHGYGGARYPAVLAYNAHLYDRDFTKDERWVQTREVLAPRFANPLSERELRDRFDRANEDIEQRLGETRSQRRSKEALAEGPPPVITTVVAAESVYDPTADTYIVTDLIRPKTVGVLVSRTGLGKSYLRTELGIRLATKHGSLFGKYPIVSTQRVMVYDAENGPDEEHRRESAILDALGIPRAHLVLYERAYVVGMNLSDAKTRAVFEAHMREREPDVVILDTIGMLTHGHEWGDEMYAVMGWLRWLTQELGVTFLLLAHFTKVGRTNKGDRPDTDIDDVMGHWARFADYVVTLSPTKDDPLRVFETHKRIPRSKTFISLTEDGVWEEQVTTNTIAPPTSVKAARQRTILEAIFNGNTVAEGDKSIGHWLDLAGLKVSRATLFRDLAEVKGQGWAEAHADGTWHLTDTGRSQVTTLRLVVDAAPSPSESQSHGDGPLPPKGGGSPDETETGLVETEDETA